MDKLPDTINKTLDALAQHFGATGTHLWHVLVQEQINEAIIGAIGWGGFWITLAYCLRKWALKLYDEDDPALYWGLIACCWVVSFIAITCVGVELQSLLNPEYYALDAISKMVKP